MPHQNRASSTGTRRKENNRNLVEVEAVMEGIFIEHARRPWTTKPKQER